MSELTDEALQEIEQKISKYFALSEIQSLIIDANKKDLKRISLDLNHMREVEPELTKMLLKYPLKIIPIMERNLNEINKNLKGEKMNQQEKALLHGKKPENIRLNLMGMLGNNLVSPRGLTADLTNQYVGVQGIVTRISLVRPKLVYSAHYCEETKSSFVKEYTDQMTISDNVNSSNRQINGNFEDGKGSGYINNAIPTKDINQNHLTFEYGFSKFRDYQTILIQEPPERTPVGQLPRSIEVILENDLVDTVKPGDRIQVNGIFKCISSQTTNSSGNVRTVLIGTSVQLLNKDIEQNELSGDDLKKIKELAKKKDVFNILANSIAPGIYGHQFIKKALILQLLGGSEINLENGTHLRGDINILMIGDPSTAKSQFLRYMLNISPNAINTTGKGSTGVGLTAAVVVDRDTGERHLEAGAMVLGDRGIVCIDEFDKMNEVDRVAIHEVMEQQTITIAKAGIHVSLNARCSVLAAANPIYGQYISDISTSRNIGFPDSLLSRFDLCFIVLDEHNSELDRKISERVINNHMFTIDAAKFGDDSEDKVIEPEISTNNNKKSSMFEKYNQHLHGKEKKEILTREFLRKYIFYVKNKINPVLTKESTEFISKSWMKLREKSTGEEWRGKIIPITVRSLETLIRLATAFAKARLSQKIEKEDCIEALELVTNSLFNETDEKEEGVDEEDENQMDLVEDEDESSQNNAKKSQKETKKASQKIKKKPKEDNEKGNNIIDINEEEEENEEIKKYSKRSKNIKGKKIKIEKEVDDLVDAPISTDAIELTEEHNNYVYKCIYTKKDKNQTIPLEDLWESIKDKKETKSLKIRKKDILLNICKKLEDEGKIFLSEIQEITII